MSEQSIHAGAAGAASNDPARAETVASTDADSTTAGEESVRATHGAAAAQGADADPHGTAGRRAVNPTDGTIETDADSVPPESDRS